MSVAVGTPGIVNPNKDMVVQAPSLPGWTSLNLAKELQRSFRCPVHVENDASLGVLGECWRGAAKSARTIVFVLWGERVGAGICIDGQLHRGATGAAGEIGFLSVLDPANPEVLVDEEGRGPFEQAVGAGAIVSMAREVNSRPAGGRSALACVGGELDAASVFAAAAAGDVAYKRVFDAVVARLARGLAPLLLVLDPDVLVVGGGISRAGQLVLNALREQVNRLVLMHTALVLSELGEEAVAIGAIRLALTDIEHRVLPSLPVYSSARIQGSQQA